MKVYVLYEWPYHDNGEILGVFSTLEKAKAAHPGNWQSSGWYVENHAGVVAELKDPDDGVWPNAITNIAKGRSWVHVE